MAKNKTTAYNLPASSLTFSDPHPSIIIHGKDNKPILEISYEGKVVWHAEDQASEAARIFCENLSISIEHKAGIKQTRKEWQDKIKSEIVEAAYKCELTEERLNEILYKDDFIDVLKGNETN